MKSKDEIIRWHVDDKFIAFKSVFIKNLQAGKKISSSILHDGFIDARCLQLNQSEEPLIKIKSNAFKKIDFTEADLSNTIWTNCEFEDCKFDKTKFSNVTFNNCVLRNLKFIKCSFKYCELGNNISKESGAFLDVSFEECFIKDIIFCFPVFKNCRFINCRIDKVDFDGSRFIDTSFVGVIEAAEFGGYSFNANTKILGLIKAFDAKDYKNEMTNVDFSGAELKYVGFNREIDLSTCKFPAGANYAIIQNPGRTYAVVEDIVMKEWNGEEKKLALDYLQIFLASNRSLKRDFLIKNVHHRNPKGYDEKLFNLIKSVDASLLS